MNYQQALEYLYHLGHEILTAHYRLERIECLLQALDHPERAYPSILIAGTNGKGSVAAMIDAILRSAGFNTGLYTSPHLVSICERIKANGKEIPPEAFAAQVARLKQTASQLVARQAIDSMPTFFEHLTAAGLAYFQEQQIDVAVVEVGLGGRLDATGAVPPFISALTRIDFDHQSILGSTLKQIASEKAAIIKPGAAAVIGPQHAGAMDAIRRQCRQSGVTPRLVLDGGARFRIDDVSTDGRITFSYQSDERVYRNIRLALPGVHQVENALVAIGVAEQLCRRGFPLSTGRVISGLETVSWPGRLEILQATGERPQRRQPEAMMIKNPGCGFSAQPTILLDGAHNLAAARVLRRYLEDVSSRSLTIVFGVMQDKPVEEMADTLFPLAQHVILTRVQDRRAADADRLARLAESYDHAQFIDSVDEAIQQAIISTPAEGMVCVTGSLYLVGDVKKWWAESAKRMPASAT